MIKKIGSKWVLDHRPLGAYGPRERKSFGTRSEAIAYLDYAKRLRTPWLAGRDPRLSEIADFWYDSHGQHLRDNKNRKQMLDNLIADLGNPFFSMFTPALFLRYRSDRIQSVKVSTVNKLQTYLSTSIRHAINSGFLFGENPLQRVQRMREDRPAMSYLTNEQLVQLLRALRAHRGDSYITACICLSSGCRWGEASALHAEHLMPGYITIHRAKNGRPRSIAISEELFIDLDRIRSERKISNGPFLRDGYSTFQRVFNNLFPNHPKGQMTHVLRHSFATHFLKNGGQLTTLRALLDHSSLAVTTRYAHHSMSDMQSAATLNPLYSNKDLILDDAT